MVVTVRTRAPLPAAGTVSRSTALPAATPDSASRRASFAAFAACARSRRLLVVLVASARRRLPRSCTCCEWHSSPVFAVRTDRAGLAFATTMTTLVVEALAAVRAVAAEAARDAVQPARASIAQADPALAVAVEPATVAGVATPVAREEHQQNHPADARHRSTVPSSLAFPTRHGTRALVRRHRRPAGGRSDHRCVSGAAGRAAYGSGWMFSTSG